MAAFRNNDSSSGRRRQSLALLGSLCDLSATEKRRINRDHKGRAGPAENPAHFVFAKSGEVSLISKAFRHAPRISDVRMCCAHIFHVRHGCKTTVVPGSCISSESPCYTALQSSMQSARVDTIFHGYLVSFFPILQAFHSLLVGTAQCTFAR